MGAMKMLQSYGQQGRTPTRGSDPSLPIRRENGKAIVWITSNRVINWYDKQTREWRVVGEWNG